MSSFFADLRHAIRVLRRAPLFTGLVVATLALAIGATAAIYSVVAPVLIRPLPYPHAERLVTFTDRDARGDADNIGYDTFDDVRTHSRTLSSAAAYVGWSTVMGTPGDLQEIVGQRVTWNYFDVLGVSMERGPGFTSDEDQPGHSDVVVLSHALWRQRFGGDPALVGRTIRLGDTPYLVAGVAPADFDNVLLPDAQIWRVLGYSTTSRFACRTCRHLNAIGRMRIGVSVHQANAELNAISARLAAAFPKTYSGRGMVVDGLQRQITAPMRPALLAILSAAVLVLMIAATNVVNLQLARAVQRDAEFTIRVALGAGRARLAQQLLAEGLILAIASGIAGLLFARVSLPILVAQVPSDLPRLNAIRLDPGAVSVVAALVLGLAFVIAVAPAVARRTRDVFDESLRGATRVSVGSRHRVRRALVVGEIALALLLLAGAGLIARSLQRLLDVDMGFEPAHLLTLRTQSTGKAYGADSMIYAYHARVVAAARAVPGVIDAGVANQLPLTGDLDTYGIRALDNPNDDPESAPYADRYTVTTGFMRAMGLRVLQGRAFDAGDVADSAAKVVIISSSLAKLLWPGGHAIGMRLTAGNNVVRTVVGIAGDVRHQRLDAKTALQFYVPDREWGTADDHVALAVRTRGDPSTVAAEVRAAVAAVDRTQPVTSVTTMEALVRASTARRHLALTLFAVFAGLALIFAAAGIYGILSGAVAERRREIGLRSALGATPRDLLAMVLRSGLAMTAVGIGAGLLGTALLSPYIHALLFGIGDTDPVALASAAVLLLAVATGACLVPAMRAVRVDPMEALRSD